MQKLEVARARFGNEIIAEFLPPVRNSNKVVIMLSGAPGYPGNKRRLMEQFSRCGYWSVVPRYRGTWESEGTFLEYPPSDDVYIVMDQIAAGFRDLWSGGDYRVHNPEFYLLGGSFGGPASILASRDERVKKAVAISAVADWRAQEHTLEPLDLMSTFVPAAFGQAYRSDPSVWHKLAQGNFYNPADEKETLPGDKLLLIHCADDKIVHPEPAQKLATDIGAKFILIPSGGHGGVSRALEPKYWKLVKNHFEPKKRWFGF